MTAPVAIRKADLARAADVAKQKGVPVMLERDEIGGATIEWTDIVRPLGGVNG